MEILLEKSRTIWIVDDSATDAKRVERLLLECQYNVEIIGDGAAALERLSSGATPDLILLDWVMPGITGIEVCRYIRSSPTKISAIPILLLTAQHGTREITEAFASGANDYVSKPFIEEELKARVKSLIQNKHFLERAEEAEKDVRALLTNAPDPIFVIDAQGKISFANKEGLDIFKLPIETILSQEFQALIPGIPLQTIGAGTGKGESILPLPDVKIDDKIFSPSIRILPSDNASTTTVVLRDVTTRRATEIRRLDFYSMIAHDLRTPLTSVLLRLQMALSGKSGILPPKHISDLQKSESTLRSMAGMINNFLELARFEGIGHKIDTQPVNIGALARETMEDYAPLLEKSKLEWTSSGLDREDWVVGDRRRISQVLSNLIGNAIKFTPYGGNIHTTLTSTKDYVEMSIKDSGNGIPEDEVPTIFERFTRGSPSGSIGSGLGLMIVKEIVEAHGGVIGVETELGIGSRFWFRIPKEKASNS